MLRIVGMIAAVLLVPPMVNQAGTVPPSYTTSSIAYLAPAPAPLPENKCRILYDDLPASYQPGAMPCERALKQAEIWGGRVITAGNEKAPEPTTVADFGDRGNDLHLLPAENLPPAGMCKTLLKHLPADRQPKPAASPRNKAVPSFICHISNFIS